MWFVGPCGYIYYARPYPPVQRISVFNAKYISFLREYCRLCSATSHLWNKRFQNIERGIMFSERLIKMRSSTLAFRFGIKRVNRSDNILSFYQWQRVFHWGREAGDMKKNEDEEAEHLKQRYHQLKFGHNLLLYLNVLILLMLTCRKSWILEVSLLVENSSFSNRHSRN